MQGSFYFQEKYLTFLYLPPKFPINLAAYGFVVQLIPLPFILCK